jgi:hypothetical protein
MGFGSVAPCKRGVLVESGETLAEFASRVVRGLHASG